MPLFNPNVTSFNNRTGAVTLTSGDVTTALGDANIAYTDVANTFSLANAFVGAGIIIRKSGGTPTTDDVTINSSGAFDNLNITVPNNGSTIFSCHSIYGAPSIRNDSSATIWGIFSDGSIALSTVTLLPVVSGVIRVAGFSGGNGWIQNSAGEAALSSSYTNATATLTNSNLSLTVIAGRSYRIEGILQISNTVAGEGFQIDFNGGAATATTFWVAAEVIGASTPLNFASATSLSDAMTLATVTGTVYVRINGYLKANAGGTFILRFAENSHSTGTATLGAGSWIALADTVPL